MDRKEELLNIFKNADESKKKIVLPLIDDVVFIENQLDELKKLPFIKIHPDNPSLQKNTPAAKLYKELCQSYINAIKVLMKCLNSNDSDEESPLRVYLKRLEKNE